MPTLEVKPPLKRDNAYVLDAIRNEASSQYYQRIPSATQAGVQATLESLHKYKPMWNEFTDALINRIGTVITRNESWTNPLAEFKRGLMSYGDTIEEVQIGLLKAHIYDPDREYLEREIFGTEVPRIESNFHRVNRQNYYRITINEDLLRRAFLEPNGLSTYVSQLMAAPATSDEWDEFLLTTSLFAEYESNGGFYHVNVPDVAVLESSVEDAKVALRKMRAMADTLPFISTKYNAAHMPTHVNRSDLVLFVSPEYNAAIDVEALAGAFNISKADMHGRVIPIPREYFGIDKCQAIMTTRDFFVILDQTLENTSQFNPVARQTNYFLHHHQIVSASRFVPAVMFHTGADDEVIAISTPVTGISAVTFDDGATNVNRGGLVQLVAEGVTTGDNDAVAWSVTGGTSSRTYVSMTGVLHVGGDETATSLTVTASTVWNNPDNPRDDAKTASLVVPVVGDFLPEWPSQGELIGFTIEGVKVPGVTKAVTTYNVSGIPGGTTTKSQVDVFAGDGANATVSVNAAGTIVTITIDYGTGAPVVYTVNVS